MMSHSQIPHSTVCYPRTTQSV